MKKVQSTSLNEIFVFLKKNKTTTLLSFLCITLLVSNVSLRFAIGRLSAEIASIREEVNRAQRYITKKKKLKTRKEKLLKKIKTIEAGLTKAPSDAIVFAKAQNLIKEIAERHDLSIDNTRLERTKKLKNNIQGTIINFRVRGDARSILNLLKDLEEKLPKQGIVLQETNISVYHVHRLKEKVPQVELSVKLKVLWKKEG